MILRTLLISSALLVAAGQLWAQSQSSGRPIRMVVPYPAGGGTDGSARVLAADLTKRLGQSVLVENRAGAGGILGAKSVVSAAPDGTTYFYGYAGNLSSVFFKTTFVDAAKELIPVSLTGSATLVFFTSAKVPARTLQELVAYAKANPPGKLNLAVQAQNVELVMHMVKNATGITFTPVNYKGSAPAAAALLAGEADVFINVWQGVGDHVASGRARALFFMAHKRSDLLPDVPLSRELGLLNFEGSAANLGVWAPLGTPSDEVLRVSRAATASAQDPETVEKIRKLGFAVIGAGPEELLRAHDAEVKFYIEAARIANFVPQ